MPPEAGFHPRCPDGRLGRVVSRDAPDLCPSGFAPATVWRARPGGRGAGGPAGGRMALKTPVGARRWQVCLPWVGALPHTSEAPQGGLSLGPRWLEEGLKHHPGIAVLWLEVTSVLPPPFSWSSGLGAWGLGAGDLGCGVLGTWHFGLPVPQPKWCVFEEGLVACACVF